MDDHRFEAPKPFAVSNFAILWKRRCGLMWFWQKGSCWADTWILHVNFINSPHPPSFTTRTTPPSTSLPQKPCPSTIYPNLPLTPQRVWLIPFAMEIPQTPF